MTTNNVVFLSTFYLRYTLCFFGPFSIYIVIEWVGYPVFVLYEDMGSGWVVGGIGVGWIGCLNFTKVLAS